jgi:hypothetical protein
MSRLSVIHRTATLTCENGDGTTVFAKAADLLPQVRCAVYNGTPGPGFGHRFDRMISNAGLTLAESA